MLSPLTESQVEKLNDQFSSLVADGKMRLSGPLPEETDHLDLPRVVFEHTRRDFGKLRMLIDAINEL